MRKIKVTVAPPVLDTILKENEALKDVYQLEFIATSYRIVNRVDGLDDPDALVLEDLKNTTDKESKVFSVDMPESTFLYVSTKHHFRITAGPKTGQELETEWGGIVPISKHDNRLKVSDVLVNTPTLYFTEKDGILNIETSKYSLYSGPGTHSSSTYTVEDTNNNPIYIRKNDEDNLTTIQTPLVFEDGKLYLVRAAHHSSTGGNSNFGTEFYNNYSAESTLFSFECGTDFISDRKFYYRLKVFNTGFVCYDLEVVNKVTQEVVISLKRENRLSHYVLYKYKSEVVDVLAEFEFYITVTFKQQSDGKLVKTNRTLVHTDTLGINRIYPYDTYTTYLEKFDNEGTIITKGITCSTFRELFDGKFIATDPTSNSLYLYKNVNGTLTKGRRIFDFPNNTDMSYINIAQMHNGNILVDAAEFDKNNQTSASFYIFEYNEFRQEFKLLKKVTRYDERYCTSMNNSLVVTGTGECWYVPAYLTNGKNSDRIPLKLRKFNLETYEIDKEIELPFVARYNVGLVNDTNNGIYVFGGSANPKYYTEADLEALKAKGITATSEEYWNLDNRTIYKLIPRAEENEKDYLEPWTSIPTEVPDNVYCLHAFLRRDGSVVMFNSVHSGDGLTYNKFIVFEPYTKTTTVLKMNGDTNLSFRTNYVFRSGNIRRISSGIKKEQQSIMYISNTKTSDLIRDIDAMAATEDSLQVLDNETVIIEDIYKYNNITIAGNGILKWVRAQGIVILTSKDLIVNKDSTFKLDDINKKQYRSILVLDGVQATIQ